MTVSQAMPRPCCSLPPAQIDTGGESRVKETSSEQQAVNWVLRRARDKDRLGPEKTYGSTMREDPRRFGLLAVWPRVLRRFEVGYRGMRCFN